MLIITFQIDPGRIILGLFFKATLKRWVWVCVRVYVRVCAPRSESFTFILFFLIFFQCDSFCLFSYNFQCDSFCLFSYSFQCDSFCLFFLQLSILVLLLSVVYARTEDYFVTFCNPLGKNERERVCVCVRERDFICLQTSEFFNRCVSQVQIFERTFFFFFVCS